jgi:hypothetical protein
MPKKTLKRQKKQRGGFIPIIYDIWILVNNKLNPNPNDKEKGRTSMIQKTKALKELISWIELSLGNIKRSVSKSSTPPLTQILNRAVFNRFNKDWFSENLVTNAQMIDYFDEMYKLEKAKQEYLKAFGHLSTQYLQQKYLKAFGFFSIQYLKQIYILITGSATDTVFDNTEKYYKILFQQEPDENQLPESSTFSVSEDYQKFLTKKFGEEYLNIFKENYNMVRKFIYSTIIPQLLPVMEDDEIDDFANAEVYTETERNNDRINGDILATVTPKVINYESGSLPVAQAAYTKKSKVPTAEISDTKDFEVPIAEASYVKGGTRKKQMRKKPRKNKTSKKQYK